MLKAAVILLTLGLSLTAADNVLRFKSEEPASRSDAETEEAPEGRSGKHLDAADPQRPTDDSKYKLSYADYRVTWESYKNKHNKQYANKDEEEKRYSIFLETVKRIESHNLKYHNGETSFYLGINHFSDLTHEEYSTRLGSGSRQRGQDDYTDCDDYHPEEGQVEDSFDWRAYGYVSSVKNQGDCGSCYTFSATGAIEGQWFQYSGNLFNLSEQQIVDCSGDFDNDGCDGGYIDTAFDYVINAGGLATYEAYSYTAQQGKCAFNVSDAVANISSCSVVRPSNNEGVLQAAVYNIGPISVSINANSSLFMSYEGGVFNNDECSQEVDHAVLIVGYGSEGCSDYWIVKNSWGPDWGEEGYVRMARDKNNQCGIASDAFFPNV